jgi:hypothetical protein
VVVTQFDTTHWSVVLKAAAGDTTGCRDALAKLCETWPIRTASGQVIGIFGMYELLDEKTAQKLYFERSRRG